MEKIKRKKNSGFTLIELLVVLGIISIISSIVIVSLNSAREKAFNARVLTEFRALAMTIEMYEADNGNYPPDAARDVPPGLEQYLANGEWPQAPWPDSFYDWDNWIDPDTGESIYQLSARFCEQGNPGSCNFPRQDWAEDFEINSAVYYCLSGPCRSHISEPIDYPGYCINCVH